LKLGLNAANKSEWRKRRRQRNSRGSIDTDPNTISPTVLDPPLPLHALSPLDNLVPPQLDVGPTSQRIPRPDSFLPINQHITWGGIPGITPARPTGAPGVGISINSKSIDHQKRIEEQKEQQNRLLKEIVDLLEQVKAGGGGRSGDDPGR
jgi:hypothetical protein